MARLADNHFGRLLREHAEAERIDISRAPAAAEPTTLAVASLDREGRASYDFYTNGTADWQWTADELARIPDDTAVFHTGSLAAWTPPGDAKILDAATRLRREGRALVSYDPNIRPALLGAPDHARTVVERSVAAVHLVKASREDAEWLYPGASLADVSRRWLELGALLVVITDGPDGAHLSWTPVAGDASDTADPQQQQQQPEPEHLHRHGRRVRVADTIGAGDAFTAGLLSAFVRRGLHEPERLRRCPPALLAEATDEAVLASALTCERPGADPPTRAELTQACAGPGSALP
jgi:fructokinase